MKEPNISRDQSASDKTTEINKEQLNDGVFNQFIGLLDAEFKTDDDKYNRIVNYMNAKAEIMDEKTQKQQFSIELV